MHVLRWFLLHLLWHTVHSSCKSFPLRWCWAKQEKVARSGQKSSLWKLAPWFSPLSLSFPTLHCPTPTPDFTENISQFNSCLPLKTKYRQLHMYMHMQKTLTHAKSNPTVASHRVVRRQTRTTTGSPFAMFLSKHLVAKGHEDPKCRTFLLLFSAFHLFLQEERNNSLSLIHIWRCRRNSACRSRWSPYH